MRSMKPFQATDIKTVIFDVDGTLYRKEEEYVEGRGSIQTAHDFFRYSAFQRLPNEDPLKLAEELDQEYQRLKDGGLIEAVQAIPQDVKDQFEAFIKQYGSNGKALKGEFGVDSGYLQRMLSNIDFESVLCEDPELVATFEHLKNQGYNLGMLTTEVFKTVDTVARVMGFDLADFEMDTGDEYKILCSENVAEKKPSLEGFLRLIDMYGDSRSIVYVGDKKEKDVEPPLETGMQAIHVVNKGPRVEMDTVNVGNEIRGYARINNVYDLREIL